LCCSISQSKFTIQCSSFDTWSNYLFIYFNLKTKIFSISSFIHIDHSRKQNLSSSLKFPWKFLPKIDLDTSIRVSHSCFSSLFYSKQNLSLFISEFLPVFYFQIIYRLFLFHFLSHFWRPCDILMCSFDDFWCSWPDYGDVLIILLPIDFSLDQLNSDSIDSLSTRSHASWPVSKTKFVMTFLVLSCEF